MDWHSQQLIEHQRNVLAYNDSEHRSHRDRLARIDGRLFAIEQDIKRIMPFIEAMELINPPPKEEQV